MNKNEVLYSVLFTIVLMLILFGDQIMLRFITNNPNPNEQLIISETKTELTFASELTINEVLDMINNKESFILLSTRDECFICNDYFNLLKNVFLKHNISSYYINRSVLDESNDLYIKFSNYDQRLKENLMYTPYLMYFKNGVLQDELVGKKTQQEIENFIKDKI